MVFLPWLAAFPGSGVPHCSAWLRDGYCPNREQCPDDHVSPFAMSARVQRPPSVTGQPVPVRPLVVPFPSRIRLNLVPASASPPVQGHAVLYDKTCLSLGAGLQIVDFVSVSDTGLTPVIAPYSQPDRQPESFVVAAGVLQSGGLKLTWSAPTVDALVAFLTSRKAHLAVEALGSGRQQGNVLGRGAYYLDQSVPSVVVSSLPFDATIDDLCSVPGSTQVTMQPPTYDLARAVQALNVRLAKFGKLLSFAPLPRARLARTISAVAVFEDTQDAYAAMTNLRGRRIRQLPGCFIDVCPSYSVTWTFIRRHFDTVYGMINQIRISQPWRASFSVSHGDGESSPIHLRVRSEETSDLCSIRDQINSVARGELLRDRDGRVLWRDNFIASNIEFLRSINAETPAFIYYCPVERFIRICGSTEAVSAARLRVLDAFEAPMLSPLSSECGTDPTAVGPGSMCPVCCTPPVEKVKLSCGHDYCRPCLKAFLLSVASTGPTSTPRIKCFGPVSGPFPPGLPVPAHVTCSKPLSILDIRKVLDYDEEQLILQAVMRSWVLGHHSVSACPTPGCDELYRIPLPGGTRSNTVTCPGCLAQTCIACRVSHPGVSCEDYRSSIVPAISGLIKLCPNCQTLIEKAGGCNHMTCAACDTHFCWLCGEQFPYVTIMQHISAAHPSVGVPGY
ncbi:hypothetical protein AURDEDRAFT_131111 [Auricularia subglabra TFB-10046 SS5]|uniref:RBR-type E3 ubiquitin transferase n=1 Tax=Auricularia subglabra (strain TFB-10046 / SS5) TaxID=717982 RepID=J0D6P7_AURST|nr:hypothetical protein AURDEDRAFT_131111 [Auricularia subglabra TFB-10046 SS5]